MNTTRHPSAAASSWSPRFVIFAVPALLGLLCLLAPACSSTGQAEAFATPEDAVQELIRAASANNTERLLAIFGPEGRDLLVSGDQVDDQLRYQRFLARYDEKHTLEADGEDRRILVIGNNEWPFPVPIVRGGNEWFFEARAGKEEILNRRIGTNELSAIETCRAIADAQREYAFEDPDGNGMHDYAQVFLSDPGKRNGLYWPTTEGQKPSPLGALIADATEEGYTAKEEGPTPYHGYYYRILRSQGPAARSGALDYVVNNKMILGFAVVAYPAEYGNSGIMTFIMRADGVVYQSDLGEETDQFGREMNSFDPGPDWEVAE